MIFYWKSTNALFTNRSIHPGIESTNGIIINYNYYANILEQTRINSRPFPIDQNLIIKKSFQILIFFVAEVHGSFTTCKQKEEAVCDKLEILMI